MEDNVCEFLSTFFYQVRRFCETEDKSTLNVTFVHIYKTMDTPFGYEFLRKAPDMIRDKFLQIATIVYENNKQYLRPKEARYVKSVVQRLRHVVESR